MSFDSMRTNNSDMTRAQDFVVNQHRIDFRKNAGRKPIDVIGPGYMYDELRATNVATGHSIHLKFKQGGDPQLLEASRHISSHRVSQIFFDHRVLRSQGVHCRQYGLKDQNAYHEVMTNADGKIIRDVYQPEKNVDGYHDLPDTQGWMRAIQEKMLQPDAVMPSQLRESKQTILTYLKRNIIEPDAVVSAPAP